MPWASSALDHSIKSDHLWASARPTAKCFCHTLSRAFGPADDAARLILLVLTLSHITSLRLLDAAADLDNPGSTRLFEGSARPENGKQGQQ